MSVGSSETIMRSGPSASSRFGVLNIVPPGCVGDASAARLALRSGCAEARLLEVAAAPVRGRATLPRCSPAWELVADAVSLPSQSDQRALSIVRFPVLPPAIRPAADVASVRAA